MATKKREHSESGFYHVFQRGVNHFDIFEDDEDREKYLSLLETGARRYRVEVHIWCLMTNHTHLILRAKPLNLSAMMRWLGSCYARYFNKRHGRSGPLFSGRFCSVCINTDSQLMAVTRYVHRNPAHHDERALYGDYPWSSYRNYINGESDFCRKDIVLSLFDGIENLVRFHEEERDAERMLDVDTVGPLSDDEARQWANGALSKAGIDVEVAAIGTLPRYSRDQAISCIRNAVGCSLRQIQRLTAIAYSAIRKALELNPHFGNDDSSNGETSLAMLFGRAESCVPGASPSAVARVGG